MNACTIEVGLLRKKPCGHAAVAHCLNCDQPLCVEHAVAQLTEGGQRTGKFLCKECADAEKAHAKTLSAVARTQEARKRAELEKAAMAHAAAPPVAKKPAVPAPHEPAQPAAAEQPRESDALEFTPKDGKLDYTPMKKDEK